MEEIRKRKLNRAEGMGKNDRERKAVSMARLAAPEHAPAPAIRRTTPGRALLTY
jgi:hypothetical protein